MCKAVEFELEIRNGAVGYILAGRGRLLEVLYVVIKPEDVDVAAVRGADDREAKSRGEKFFTADALRFIGHGWTPEELSVERPRPRVLGRALL